MIYCFVSLMTTIHYFLDVRNIILWFVDAAAGKLRQVLASDGASCG